MITMDLPYNQEDPPNDKEKRNFTKPNQAHELPKPSVMYLSYQTSTRKRIFYVFFCISFNLIELESFRAQNIFEFRNIWRKRRQRMRTTSHLEGRKRSETKPKKPRTENRCRFRFELYLYEGGCCRFVCLALRVCFLWNTTMLSRFLGNFLEILRIYFELFWKNGRAPTGILPVIMCPEKVELRNTYVIRINY